MSAWRRVLGASYKSAENEPEQPRLLTGGVDSSVVRGGMDDTKKATRAVRRRPPTSGLSRSHPLSPAPCTVPVPVALRGAGAR